MSTFVGALDFKVSRLMWIYSMHVSKITDQFGNFVYMYMDIRYINTNFVFISGKCSSRGSRLMGLLFKKVNK